ncbi:TusE/DsrC/DsvC family sulfur relay protein [Sulfurivermis fontis]|uniref:TusE/DsrC/DsvC family sulfur relay protein n=1 Tax=Sulfurivermis fontis TaxID=1972068 RepID=UPI000FDAF7DF|nr:TusE/DsrC/DsvC family sulfur relay protein [Sulfurivermis fontis]
MSHVDINKFIHNAESVSRDPDGHMLELPPWDEREAARLAQEEGIALTADHWNVVHFLREHYRRNGRAPSGRVLSAALEEAFNDYGGRRWLYSLFPRGPVVQGSRIAGLPLPPYSADASFGSVE